MEKYTILLYETLKQAVEVKADNEEDAIDQVRAWRAQGMLKPGELTGLDFDVLDVQPLRDEPLQRFEILGQPALFTDMDKQEIDWLQGTEGLYHYDLRHGDDDSYPLTVETEVVINRFGTVFTAKPLLEHDMQYRRIGEDDWGFCSDLEDCTLTQFAKEMLAQEAPNADREFEILQLNRENSVYAFCNYGFLWQKGVQLNASQYDSVYKGTMQPGMNLENIFTRFNINRPEDFRGHSLSVSDVVIIRDNKVQTAYFVDSFGFKELPGFFDTPVQEKKTAEKQPRQAPKKGTQRQERT